jgi:hypothetical protein
MFLTTAFLYPLVLALLCLGAGLLVDRISGSPLPAALLPTVGVAALVALSQLLTYVYPLAPSTPYMSGVSALAGFWFGRYKAIALARSVQGVGEEGVVGVVGDQVLTAARQSLEAGARGAGPRRRPR